MSIEALVVLNVPSRCNSNYIYIVRTPGRKAQTRFRASARPPIGSRLVGMGKGDDLQILVNALDGNQLMLVEIHCTFIIITMD
jgi:hypothetical protein